MAWSYRNDLLDEVYASTSGVTLVEGKDLPATPASPEDAQDMLEPDVAPKTKKSTVDPKSQFVTQFQEHPGQNVPRVIVGTGKTEKDTEIAEAMTEEQKRVKEEEAQQKKEVVAEVKK